MEKIAANAIIDNIYNATEDVVDKYLLDTALMAVCGSTTGFFAAILTPLIKVIFENTAFKLARMVKREAQMQIDIIEGKITIKKVDDAKISNDEHAYINAISRY